MGRTVDIPVDSIVGPTWESVFIDFYLGPRRGPTQGVGQFIQDILDSSCLQNIVNWADF